ncbi:SRPBCC family protein [Acaryochloris sp. IP29b_bin.148]|uniref:SRPBCC family protein n=1 Tax=Acaryochloris sp. IP29b_bin.148 TaxID=2969218 RepID=UPI00262785DA|nr:SRPBCC family protein [Acaryochloris sp. IP29b_bin.148]
MHSLSATVSTHVNTDQAVAFETIVPIDLTTIFQGYGPLPAVTSVEGQSGAWDTVGQTRVVLLSDQSSLTETLTQYNYPNYFSYTLSDFTGSLRFLTSSAQGEWWFSQREASQTYIQWRYAFQARSILAIPLLWLLVNGLWCRYMHRTLQRAQTYIRPNENVMGMR